MALNNTPNTGQSLRVTRNPINQNFATINAAFLINHGEYNIADQGKHTKIQMPQQSSDPGTGMTEVALVAKAGTGGTQLFFQPASGVASYEITGKTASSIGSTRLPSGIIIKWGYGVGSGLQTYTFDPAMPFTTVYRVYCTPNNVNPGTGDPVTFDFNGWASWIDCPTTGTFRAWTGQRSAFNVAALVQFNYYAIGV